MKRFITIGIIGTLALLMSGCHHEVDVPTKMSVNFEDAKWEGKMIPKTEVCKWAKGDGSTPTLNISGIPNGTEKIIVMFNDKTYKPMDNGGHGQIGINITPNQKTITIPSIKGETKMMPENMFIHKEHIGLKRGSAGAYLPPCSGGKGNTYSATIKAMDKDNKTLQSSEIIMGIF